jgi:hypothetical protein
MDRANNDRANNGLLAAACGPALPPGAFRVAFGWAIDSPAPRAPTNIGDVWLNASALNDPSARQGYLSSIYDPFAAGGSLTIAQVDINFAESTSGTIDAPAIGLDSEDAAAYLAKGGLSAAASPGGAIIVLAKDNGKLYPPSLQTGVDAAPVLASEIHHDAEDFGGVTLVVAQVPSGANPADIRDAVREASDPLGELLARGVLPVAAAAGSAVDAPDGTSYASVTPEHVVALQAGLGGSISDLLLDRAATIGGQLVFANAWKPFQISRQSKANGEVQRALANPKPVPGSAVGPMGTGIAVVPRSGTDKALYVLVVPGDVNQGAPNCYADPNVVPFGQGVAAMNGNVPGVCTPPPGGAATNVYASSPNYTQVFGADAESRYDSATLALMRKGGAITLIAARAGNQLVVIGGYGEAPRPLQVPTGVLYLADSDYPDLYGVIGIPQGPPEDQYGLNLAAWQVENEAYAVACQGDGPANPEAPSSGGPNSGGPVRPGP